MRTFLLDQENLEILFWEVSKIKSTIQSLHLWQQQEANNLMLSWRHTSVKEIPYDSFYRE